jgi:uncharacterized membrane protein YecN with MAPEG domain
VQDKPFQSFFTFFRDGCRFGHFRFVLLVETNKTETKMTLPITSLTAAVLAVVFLILTYQVIKVRSAAGISILHGDNMDLALKMRVHANFAEFVPLALIVMALAEIAGGNATALLVAGVLLVVSRIVIPFGISLERFNHPVRIAGNVGTHLSILTSVVLIIMAQLS